MKISATLLVCARLAAVTAGLGIGACGGSTGKMKVDSPATPYQKPDISEITGIEDPDDSDADAGSGSAAPGK